MAQLRYPDDMDLDMAEPATSLFTLPEREDEQKGMPAESLVSTFWPPEELQDEELDTASGLPSIYWTSTTSTPLIYIGHTSKDEGGYIWLRLETYQGTNGAKTFKSKWVRKGSAPGIPRTSLKSDFREANAEHAWWLRRVLERYKNLTPEDIKRLNIDTKAIGDPIHKQRDLNKLLTIMARLILEHSCGDSITFKDKTSLTLMNANEDDHLFQWIKEVFDADDMVYPRYWMVEGGRSVRQHGNLRASRPSLIQQPEVTAEEFERLDQVQNVDELAVWMKDTKLRQREKKSKAKGYELARSKFEQFFGMPVLMDVLKEADFRNPDDIRKNGRLQEELRRLKLHAIYNKDLKAGIKPTVRKTRKRKAEIEEAGKAVRQKNETTENKDKKEFRLKVPELPVRQQFNLVLLGKAIDFRWKP